MFGVETLHCPSSPKPHPPGVMKRPLEKNKTLPGIRNPISGAWNDSPRVYMAPEWALARFPLAVGTLNQTFEASKGTRNVTHMCWWWWEDNVLNWLCFLCFPLFPNNMMAVRLLMQMMKVKCCQCFDFNVMEMMIGRQCCYCGCWRC